jgi:DNA polymerase III subunit gamma/tau
MAGQALYRKWRSQTFEEVVGQEHVSLTLRNAIREGHLSHAYLFTGPRGTGKTSTARILAKALNCLAEDPAARPCNRCHICTAITEGRLLDLIEIDAASNRGIDEIRDLREKISFRPNEARYKVYIIDEVHMLTKEAFNALLKTLEEPPPHAVFVLATTEPDRVPETVRSRCQRFDFRRVPTARIAEHLGEILEAEGGRAAPEALLAIARRSTGSMRDAISLLDQLLSYGDEVIGLARVEGVLGLVDAETIAHLVDHMVTHDAGAGLQLINQLVANGVELGELVDQILAYLRAVLFAQAVHSAADLDLPEEAANAVMRQAAALQPSAVLAALREYSEARAALRDQVPGAPQLPIEMAFLRSALEASAPASLPAGPAAVATAGRPSLAVGGPAPAADRSGQAEREQTEHAKPEHQLTERRLPAEQETRSHVRQGDTRAEANAGDHLASPPGGAGGDAELRRLLTENWDRILELTRQKMSIRIKAALQTVRQLDVSGGVIVMQFEHDHARVTVDKPEIRPGFEALLAEVLGRQVHVRYNLVEGKQAPGGRQPARPPAEQSGNDDEVLLRDAVNRGAVVKRLDKQS